MTAMVAALFISPAGMSVPLDAAGAADCHAEPQSDAPEGSHWYYHMDRGQHRKCWHLHADQSGQPHAKPAASEATPAASDAKPAPAQTKPAAWRHRPEPVSDQELEQDKTKCESKGNSAPVGAGSPEFKFYLLFSECMRTAGYELVAPAQ